MQGKHGPPRGRRNPPARSVEGPGPAQVPRMSSLRSCLLSASSASPPCSSFLLPPVQPSATSPEIVHHGDAGGHHTRPCHSFSDHPGAYPALSVSADLWCADGNGESWMGLAGSQQRLTRCVSFPLSSRRHVLSPPLGLHGAPSHRLLLLHRIPAVPPITPSPLPPEQVTVRAEYLHIWPSRFTTVKLCFFVNRYLTLACMAFILACAFSEYLTSHCGRVHWLQVSVPVRCSE